MKKTAISMALFFAGVLQLQAQSKAPKSLGLPGDNFNLYAALKLFQESRTLEVFERNINDPDQKINNLDLDGDDRIDYIRVTDRVRDDVHSITLQVGLGNQEEQDIAVFVVAKDNQQNVFVQVIGDEDLYGKDYIIEPNYNEDYQLQRNREGTPNPAFQFEYEDEYIPATRNTISYVQVANWPIVKYIYVPTYRPWVSNWGWNRYPSWWRPWRPYSWHWYAGFHYNYFNIYFGFYHRTHVYRNPSWYNWHYGNNGWRSRSVVYVDRYKKGYYKTTYSRPQSFEIGYGVSRNRVPVHMRPSSSTRPMPGNVRPGNNGGRSREIRQEPPGRGSRESNGNGNGRGRSNGNGNRNGNGNENGGRPSRHYN